MPYEPPYFRKILAQGFAKKQPSIKEWLPGWLDPDQYLTNRCFPSGLI
ncbi:MAG: hypothetical protein ACTSVU_00825 [Promethearchaeota archaeon]